MNIMILSLCHIRGLTARTRQSSQINKSATRREALISGDTESSATWQQRDFHDDIRNLRHVLKYSYSSEPMLNRHRTSNHTASVNMKSAIN